MDFAVIILNQVFLLGFLFFLVDVKDELVLLLEEGFSLGIRVVMDLLVQDLVRCHCILLSCSSLLVILNICNLVLIILDINGSLINLALQIPQSHIHYTLATWLSFILHVVTRLSSSHGDGCLATWSSTTIEVVYGPMVPIRIDVDQIACRVRLQLGLRCQQRLSTNEDFTSLLCMDHILVFLLDLG